MNLNKKTVLVTLAALFAGSASAYKNLEFCREDQEICESKCASKGGRSIETGTKKGFMCLPNKFKNCQSNEDCQTDALCSDAFGLLTEDTKVCLPSRFSSIQRADGESCLTGFMCASRHCSEEGRCMNTTVTEKEGGVIHKRKMPEGKIQNSVSRNLQTYSSAQYCTDYKQYYYSYSFYCPSDFDGLFSSLGSLTTTTTTTYSSAQYCSTYKTYYYSKSYTCPSAISLYNIGASANDALSGIQGFNGAVSAAKSILGAIIGGIVGGIVFIIILIVICCYCCCKKKQAAPVDVGAGHPQHTTQIQIGGQPQPMQPGMQPVMQPVMQPMYPGMMPQQQAAPIIVNV